MLSTGIWGVQFDMVISNYNLYKHHIIVLAVPAAAALKLVPKLGPCVHLPLSHIPHSS